jgi:hypothetical protein
MTSRDSRRTEEFSVGRPLRAGLGVGGGSGQAGEREADDEHREAGGDSARQAGPWRFAEQPDADGHAGHRGDRGDDRQREHGPAGLIGGLRQQYVARPAHDQGVDGPRGEERCQAVARPVRERHGHDRRAGIRQPRGHGQEDRAAASRGAQPGGGGRQRADPRHGRAQARRHGVVRLAGQVTVTRRGQRQERRGGRDGRQRGGPGGPAERTARPDADDHHRDDELHRHQHLHGRQRSRPQRDRVRREPADLGGDSQQPPGLARKQKQQPRPSRQRLRCRGRLPLLYRRPGPVEHGGGQRGRDHHYHEHHARSDASCQAIRQIPHSAVGLTPIAVSGRGLRSLEAARRKMRSFHRKGLFMRSARVDIPVARCSRPVSGQGWFRENRGW